MFLLVSSGTNIKIRPFRILTCVYPGVPAGYKYSIDSPGGFNSMTAVTRKHIPGFVCALALFAAAAANADTGADKSAESLVCTTMTNALNFAFTMQQGTAVQMECRLDSFRKLDDQHMKEWLVKAEKRNKKCIEDQTRAVRMARALGYSTRRVLVSPICIRKWSACLSLPMNSRRFQPTANRTVNT